MVRIEKKTWPDSFEMIRLGKKKFELRINDFEVREGDILVLREYDPDTKKYTGRTIEKKVTYVLKFKSDELAWYSADAVEEYGLQVLSLE